MIADRIQREPDKAAVRSCVVAWLVTLELQSWCSGSSCRRGEGVLLREAGQGKNAEDPGRRTRPAAPKGVAYDA